MIVMGKSIRHEWINLLQEGGEFHPKDASGKVIYSDVDYLDTWKVKQQMGNIMRKPIMCLRTGFTQTGLCSHRRWLEA